MRDSPALVPSGSLIRLPADFVFSRIPSPTVDALADIDTPPRITRLSEVQTGTVTPVQAIRRQVQKWSGRFSDRSFEGTSLASTRWEMGGSVACGNFWGPKPASLSSNPDRPPHFERLIECDGRFMLPKGMSPHDPKVITMFEKIVEGKAKVPVESARRWGTDQPVTRIYTYKDLGGKLGLEFEICLVQHDFLEIAKYWKTVFSPDEIENQRNMRAQIVAWGLGKDAIRAHKNAECNVCRWRVIAGYGLKELLTTGRLVLPEGNRAMEAEIFRVFKGVTPPVLQPIVSRWLNGAERTEDGVRRAPEGAVAPALEHFREFRPSLLQPRVRPSWVELAEAVFDLIKAEHTKHAGA